MTNAARVLVVDDSATARKKLALAVAALGHEVDQASGGAEALDRLQREPFDLVLLDILMPDVDGFEVLRFLRRHERLRDVPVLVISGLENDPGSVIEGIRLGAIDFLPKAFEPVLLEARVGAALRRKRARDEELAEQHRVERLTDAAGVLETSLVEARHLGITDLATRDDPLGRFAATFERLASALHAHERAQRRRLAARRGLALLLLAGVLFGLATPLAKIAATDTPKAMGLSLWVNALTATLCLSITAWRRRWPRWSAELGRFLLFWGVFGAALAEVMLFSAARVAPASTLSIVIVLESFIVFAIAATLGAERATTKRLIGLALGLMGVLLVLEQQAGGGAGNIGVGVWMLLALAVPACYAIEDLLLAHRMPIDLDVIAAVGLASLVGLLALVVPVWWFDQALAPGDVGNATIVAIVGITLASLIGTALHARLTASAGAVFGSQIGYVMTLAGIVWAMLLLGERLAPGLWAALALSFVGLLLVEPKREPDDVLDVGVFDVSR